jgi:competence protein ComEA
VLVLLALAAAVLIAALSPHGETTVVGGPGGADSSESYVDPSDPADSTDPSGDPDDLNAQAGGSDGGGGGAPPLFVHILGEVANPGLYELREGDRAIDAVAAAGGLTEAADEAQLNLARFLNDGEQIVVPAVGAAPVAGAVPGTGGSVTGTGAGGAGAAISINSADAATLEDLPGVGPELAARIVAWRETNGPYTSVDDLLNVAGIGEKTVDGLRDSATV